MRRRSLSRHVRNGIARALLRWLGEVLRDRPIPVDLVSAIRLVAVGDDPLVAQLRPVPADRAIAGPLSLLLEGRELGTWALGPKSLKYLRDLVLHERPRTVIEFGSGVSTVVLAHAMREAGVGSETPAIISFEQDETQAARTLELLSKAGLTEFVSIVLAALGTQRIEGVVTTCYVLPNEVMQLFSGRRADLVIVDGPAAEAGARFGTLPLARPFVGRTAAFVLDDALRDGELTVARRWRSLPYVKVGGIRLVEKGLLIGMILGH